MTVAMWPSDTEHPILRDWLRGSTCHNHYTRRAVLFENEAHIVLKHGSHPSYTGRFSGSQTCRAYAALYRKADLVVDEKGYNRDLFNGSGEIARWEGRISKRRVREKCEAMGIVFDT